jgi:hypothetical protein
MSALLSISSLSIAATNGAAQLTADNEFWLYTGNVTAGDLQFVGHGANWGTSYAFNFDINPGDYLYVMAWDWGQPHAWQGVFTTPVGIIRSNAVDWVGAATTSTTVNASVIGSANWVGIQTDLPYGSGPWGGHVGDPQADWIWTSGLYSGDTMVLFRTVKTVASIPEPDRAALFLAGLGLLGIAKRIARRSLSAPRRGR